MPYLQLDVTRVSMLMNVEFTEHDRDEMYHPALGGYSPDWKPGEA